MFTARRRNPSAISARRWEERCGVNLSDGALRWPLAPARECIRATVMGAAQHTVQVSGNTIYRTDENLLPQKNLQVLRPDVDLTGEIVSATIAEAIQNHFRVFDLIEGQAEVALVFRWDGPPTRAPHRCFLPRPDRWLAADFEQRPADLSGLRSRLGGTGRARS